MKFRNVLFLTFCIKGNVNVGHLCLHEGQCTESKRSGLCRHDVCTCQAGYILIDNTCYQGITVILS